jgi:hypothetical protein
MRAELWGGRLRRSCTPVKADTSGNTNNLIGIFRCENPRDARPTWNTIYFDPDPHNIPHGLGLLAATNDVWPAAAFVPYFALAIDPLDWNTLFLGGMSWLYRVQVIEQNGFIVDSNWTKWDDGSFYDHRCMTFLGRDILLAPATRGCSDCGTLRLACRGCR